MSDDRLMRDLADEVGQERGMDVPDELARPFDEGELDAIVDGARATMRGADVVPIGAGKKKPRWALWAGIATPLAAAAVLILALQPVAPVAGTNQTGSGVPTYDLSIEGGERETRGAADEAPKAIVRVGRSGHLVIVARPRVPAKGEVRARVLVERPDGALVNWNVQAVASSEGAIRVDARGPALAALPDGPSRVIVLVADPDHMPTDSAATRRAVEGSAGGVQVLSQAIEVAP